MASLLPLTSRGVYFPWWLALAAATARPRPDLTAGILTAGTLMGGTWPRPQALVNAPTREFHPVRPSSLATAWIRRASIGSIAVGNTAAMWPSRPIRYL